MIGNEKMNTTLEYLEGLIKNINANQGIVNCGHCALRLDLHIREGQNLGLAAVPTTTAEMFRYPHFQNQSIIRSISKDSRLIERCTPDKRSLIREICNLNEETPQFIVDLTAESTAENTLRLHRATVKDIYQQLRDLPRRNKDDTAYGFLMLTHEKDTTKGHIINFFVDSNNEVYFLDAQRRTKVEQINRVLFLKGYRPEIFFIPSCPPEGNKLAVKKEKDVERELFVGFSSDDNEEAIIQAKNKIKDEPQNIAAWVALITCYKKANRKKYLENILRCKEKVHQLENNDISYAYYWAAKADMQTNLAEVITCFDKIFDCKGLSNEKQADLWSVLAANYSIKFGLRECALHCFLYANQLDPRNKIIWQALKGIYEKMPNHESKALLCASNIQKIESNLPPLPLNEKYIYFNNRSYFIGDSVPRPHLHLKLNSTVVASAPSFQTASVAKPASPPQGMPVPMANKPASAPQGMPPVPMSIKKPALPPQKGMPITAKPASSPSVAQPPKPIFIPGLAIANPTYLPSQTSSATSSSAVMPNPSVLSEVDWLKKEVAIKQRRIEVMEDEIKMKDQQIAELKRQLEEKNPALNQRPSK